MRFLVTRPMAMAAETAGKLQALGHEALPAPMLDIVARAVGDLPAGAFDAIILTSRNAVEVLAQSETLARYRLTPCWWLVNARPGAHWSLVCQSP